MKKVITMVGTSLFENYMDKKEDDSFRHHFNCLKEKEAKDYEDEEDRIEVLRRKIHEWLSDSPSEIINASAEIKSLKKLKEFIKDHFEIYFLTSDTILSNVAGEILKDELLPKLDDLKDSQIYLYQIKDLQVQDSNRFRSGMVNLINKISDIAKDYWKNVIINITGGYKATIPYLTILAQVNKCPLYYIFEKTDSLIEIPYIPLDIKWEIFERNEEFFFRLEKESVQEIRGVSSEHYDDVESLLEKADNLISLNPLGIVLWERYKQRVDLFYVTELVKEYLKRDKKYEKVGEKSFLELKRRFDLNPHDPDLNHGLRNVDLREFKCFKHKEENLQVRVLYKPEERTTRYGSKEIDIYIGLIRIGQDVHNVESEYVRDFQNNYERIKDVTKYKLFRIKKEEHYVS